MVEHYFLNNEVIILKWIRFTDFYENCSGRCWLVPVCSITQRRMFNIR